MLVLILTDIVRVVMRVIICITMLALRVLLNTIEQVTARADVPYALIAMHVPLQPDIVRVAMRDIIKTVMYAAHVLQDTIEQVMATADALLVMVIVHHAMPQTDIVQGVITDTIYIITVVQYALLKIIV